MLHIDSVNMLDDKVYPVFTGVMCDESLDTFILEKINKGHRKLYVSGDYNEVISFCNELCTRGKVDVHEREGFRFVNVR